MYAEYIWWNLHQEGLHYAISGIQNAPANTLPPEGELFALDGDWSSGFRVGAGIFFPCNAWRVNLDWLRYRHDESDATSAQTGLTLRATRGLPTNDNDTLNFGSADFDCKLDSIRLSLLVPLFTRAHISLNPSIGIRIDSIRNTFNIFYQATNVVDQGRIHHSLQYCGTGPEIGLDATWYLLPCVSIFGDIKAAGLYGQADTHQTFQDNDADEDGNFRHRIERLQTTLGTSLGVAWEGTFFRNIYLALKLGWETNIWFDFDTIYSFVSSAEEGNLINVANDLKTSGITFRASLSF